MQFLPDQQNARPTAIMLLVISLILVYVLVFHWFIIRHREYAVELGDLRSTLARFESVAAMRDTVEEELQRISDSREDSSLFLPEADFNVAAASMNDRLGQMVRTLAESDCQIVSRQPVPPRVQERYDRVTVNVRMRCQLVDLLSILHQLESGVPMIIVDDLNIIKPRARVRAPAAAQSQNMDIRFNMSGYLNQ